MISDLQWQTRYCSFVGKETKDLVGELGSKRFVDYKKNGLFERFRETVAQITKLMGNCIYLVSPVISIEDDLHLNKVSQNEVSHCYL